jgi:uncharacterized protein
MRMIANLLSQRMALAVLLAISLGNVACADSPAAAATLQPLDNFPQSALTILSADARQHRFKIWVADSEAHREQGLMQVKSLADHTGMLFIFNQPRRIQMWMKNTLIPLDMVFIDANGRIDSIVANATPMSLKIIDSQRAVLAVLELAGGSTTTLGIHAGGIVKHPFFASLGGSR